MAHAKSLQRFHKCLVPMKETSFTPEEALEGREGGQPLTIKQLLGRDLNIADPEKLPLSDSPISISQTTLENGGNLFSVSIQFPFRSSELVGFLNELAPNKNMAASGIISDWEMPKSKSPYFDDLRSMHSNLPGWQEFIGHLDQLRNLLSEPDLDTVLRRVQSRTRSGEGLDRYIRDKSNPVFRTILEKPDNPFFKRVKKAAAEELRSQSQNEWNRLGQVLIRFRPLSYQFFLIAEKYEQERILSGISIVRNRDYRIVDRDYLIANLPGILSGIATVINQDGETVLIFENDEQIKGLPRIKYLGDGRIYAQDSSTSFEADINVDSFGVALVVDEKTLVQPQPAYPVVRWKKDAAGKREFDLSILEESHYNSFLGLLVVLYFDLESRGKLPAKLSLPGGKRPQFMGAAQIPLLAYMFRNEILKSPFIEKVEEYAKGFTNV